jgi:transcription elongation GreA/GreB family factor
MYARRMHEANGVLTILERAKGIQSGNTVGFGSLVITDKMNFFIAASVGKFDLEGSDYFIISAQTPIYQAMEGKTIGDSFSFRNQKYTIKEVV